MFLNKIKDQYRIVSDVIDLKPRLKDKKQKDLLDASQPRFDQATLRVKNSNTYAYAYELVATVPVPTAFIRNKKFGMGKFVPLLHDFIDERMGRWMGQPTIGGLNARARKGMLSVEAKWYFDDPVQAYSFGYDLTETFGSFDVVEKNQIPHRANLAEKAIKEMKGYKESAQKKLNLRTKDEDERNAIWKSEFMPGFVKLVDAYEKKGISSLILQKRA